MFLYRSSSSTPLDEDGASAAMVDADGTTGGLKEADTPALGTPRLFPTVPYDEDDTLPAGGGPASLLLGRDSPIIL
jgi:hypothetical protein